MLHTRTLQVSLALLLAAVVCPAALAGAELELEDGQVVSGVDVELKDGLYTLELEDGSFLILPAALVRELRLSGGEAEAGPPEPIREPAPSEQLAVFREPAARFPRNLVDHRWRPESDWDLDPEQNNFSPTTWIETSFDAGWEPVNAYSWNTDVTRFNQARWQKGVVDPVWYPRNGFR